MSPVIIKLQRLVSDYLLTNYAADEIKLILPEIKQIIELKNISDLVSGKYVGYDTLQDALSTLNEKECIRKSKGVYYTPSDVVEFISNQSVFQPKEGAPNYLLSTIFDPTCGAGEFLIFALTKKFHIVMQENNAPIQKEYVHNILRTIYGNDINRESIIVSQIRLFICTLKFLGVNNIKGVARILKSHFTTSDFVATQKSYKRKFDIILGNPPYVEDGKCDTTNFEKYGNIYCNVLKNAVENLKPNGRIGFIIPLSYVSTPRMEKIRSELKTKLEYQKIYSFADRPDCLFSSVHQKLCILIGKKGNGGRIYTSSYNYWYKEEREHLFADIQLYENSFSEQGCIPKLGSQLQAEIYKKITCGRTALSDLLNGQGYDIYLNMRACFWIKAFTKNHKGSEYKNFQCNSSYDQHLAMAILNSSLFWWFWNCVSDCWHITQKELVLFKLPSMDFSDDIVRLAQCLENKLEITKKYVGTKQTDYEYKHKSCTPEIESIDLCVNRMFGLSEQEGQFIISYARKYRLGGINE